MRYANRRAKNMPRHLFTAQEYAKMAEFGIFPAEVRVELLAGEIIEQPKMAPLCARCVVNLTELLHNADAENHRVGVSIPLLLDERSVPEPDLMVYRRRKRETHPTPDDILLVIEVADSSLDYDRNRKFPRYAAAGIPEAWLFDIFAGVLERHTAPFEGRYRRVEAARQGESLTSTTVPGLTLAVDDILAEE